MQQEKSIVIVGGGILGMTISLRLAEMGHTVSLYEASPKLGGLASDWEFEGITWDKFYHVILMSDINTRNILKELGIEDKMNWVETKTGFYTDKKLYSMSNTIEFLKFPPLGLIDKFRLGITIFAASKIKNWKRLESQKVTSWLTKWSGKSTFDKIWLPLLRAKLGDFYTETSAAFIWATIQRMYAARRSGLKKEMFGYIDGGYKTILESFEEHIKQKGVKVFTSYGLEKVETNETRHSLKFNNGVIVDADKVIFSIPSSSITKVWPEMPGEEKLQHSAIQYMGVSCTSVLLKKSLSLFYVTNITDSNVPFTGIIEMSALVDKANFKGNSLLYLPKYVAPNDPIFDRSDEEIHNEFKKIILEMYPHIAESDFISMQTAKARNVFALSTLNYSKNLPVVRSSVPNVYFANSAYITNGTLNINETIEVAEKFVKDNF